MKAKKALFLTVSFILIAIGLFVLQNLLGVSITGHPIGRMIYMILTGFAGVVLWIFWETMQ